MKKIRGEERLRRNRVTIVGAKYFATLCVLNRRPVLNIDRIASAIRAELGACEADGHWQLLAFTMMPDHLHLLFRFTGVLPVQRVIARFKSKTGGALASARATWQPNFFEHRLRADEPLEPIVRYIFENPYRAGVIPVGMAWPFHFAAPEINAWFDPLTNQGSPFPEWLGHAGVGSREQRS